MCKTSLNSSQPTLNYMRKIHEISSNCTTRATNHQRILYGVSNNGEKVRSAKTQQEPSLSLSLGFVLNGVQIQVRTLFITLIKLTEEQRQLSPASFLNCFSTQDADSQR